MKDFRVKVRREGGAALIVAMLLLAVASIVALSAVRYSVLAMRVAGNQELRLTAYENAQSVVDATVADGANTPVLGGVAPGTVVACTAGNGATGCSGGSVAQIAMPSSFMASEVSASQVRVRVTVLDQTNCPRRTGMELDSFACALFKVESTYDHNASNDSRGKSELSAGVIVVYPKT